MTVQTYDVKNTVTITPEAAEHFAKQLEKKGGEAVRISLKEAGCTGFKYVIEEVDAAQNGDTEIKLQNGVSVFLDSKHLDAIRGMVIDYTQEGLNQNLILDNPNIKASCGCGESFSV